ncbi:MAG: ABC transporter permease [Thermoplasmatota archaeon]
MASRSLQYYVLGRLLLAIPMLVILVTFVFVLLHIAPGDPVLAIAPPAAPEATIEALRHQLGLDRPLWVQYLEYLRGLATLHLGQSLTVRGVEVTQRISATFPPTLELTLAAMVVAVVVGVGVGLLAGARRGTGVDLGGRLFGILIYSAPIFWLGLIAILAFAQPYVRDSATASPFWRATILGALLALTGWIGARFLPHWRSRRAAPLIGLAVGVAIALAVPTVATDAVNALWPQLPTGGRGRGPIWAWGSDFGNPAHTTGMNTVDSLIALDGGAFLDNLRHLALPATTLGLVIGGIFLRITRVNVMQTMRADYADAARSRGVSEVAVVWRHAFKNALIPIVTVVGLTFALLLGGAILTENVFNWPGIARELTRALAQRDYPIVQGITAFFAAIVVVLSLAIDLVNAWIDPRIRY